MRTSTSFRAPVRAAALLAIALPIFLGACGKSDNNSKLQIAVIPKGTTHEFWKAVHAGAETAALELGVEVLWKGPIREDDRAAQVQVVEDFVVRG
ncbi:MAG: ribose transport system substrate-binding protein, partial [Planctomycetota bacterium]